MTTTPPEPTTVPPEEQVDEQLTALETAAAAAIAAFVAGALAQLPPLPVPGMFGTATPATDSTPTQPTPPGPTARPGRQGLPTALAAERLRDDPGTLIDTLVDTITQAATLAGPTNNPDSTRRLITDTLDTVHQTVTAALTETAQSLGANIDPTPPSEQLQRLIRRLTGAVATWIYQAYNRIIEWRARTTGTTTEWHTREDQRVCPICGPLHGTTAGPDGYPANTTWDGYTGIPPAHPWCRCRLRIRSQ